MGYYPIFVELAGRRCLVVGGGNVAITKVTGLLNAEGEVTVVGPDLHPQLQKLLDEGRIRHIAREYQQGDVDGYDIVMVATDDGAINRTVATHAREQKIWVNSSDDFPNCDFILPSVVRKGKIVLAASTGGASPALARRLRKDLEAFLTDEYALLGDVLAEVRRELRAAKVAVDAEVWQRAIDGRLWELLSEGRFGEAKAHVRRGLGVPDHTAKDTAAAAAETPSIPAKV